jgi:hypothetical protein
MNARIAKAVGKPGIEILMLPKTSWHVTWRKLVGKNAHSFAVDSSSNILETPQCVS